MTDYYSIENYLVSIHMLKRVWTDYFHFREGDIPDFEIFAQEFEKQLNEFHNLMIPIMAWITIVRRHGKRPNLAQLDLKNFFKIDDDLVITEVIANRYLNRQEALEKLCGVSTPPAAIPEIKILENELRKYPPKSYVRGKFEIWFFCKYIKQLAEGLRSKKDLNFVFDNEAHIEVKQIVQSLSPRVTIPTSLKTFLQKNTLNFK